MCTFCCIESSVAITHSTVNEDCLGLVIPVELKQLNEESPQLNMQVCYRGLYTCRNNLTGCDLSLYLFPSVTRNG